MKTITTKTPHEALFGSVQELLDWCGEIPQYGKRHDKGTVWYYNVPAAFDIEFTSTYVGEGRKRHKVGIMYVWTFCLNGGVIYGRTWEDWIAVCDYLQQALDLSEDRRLIIYCRNLETEFQYMRGWFDWLHVFSVNLRRPVYAVCTQGIEFRCSYILSGESLATSGKKLRTYKIRKLEGDLDYTKVRHSGTYLSDQELDYAINDTRVDVAYIQEKMDDVEGIITRVQLTKTGYVRKYCRDACFYGGRRGHKRGGWQSMAYRNKMQHLVMDPDEYIMLRRAFQGGFTHASARFSGTIQEHVDSWDLTSSYPTSMVAYKYPMSRGEKITIHNEEELRFNLMRYCCVFDIEFTDLCIKDTVPDCPISASKCWHVRGHMKENNGRVARCDGSFVTTITNVDFEIYEQFYTWEKIRIGTFYRYRRGYLPTPLVESVITMYERKTTLKNVPEREQEYVQAKENVNSIYGMIVTDICRPENAYEDGEWIQKPPDIEKEIAAYNENPQRFLFYTWGIFVTAFSRARLFKAIMTIGESGYYYSDTDSVKIVRGERFRPFFEKENEDITRRIRKALTYHRIDPARACPKTIKGVEKPLGVWDYEGQYLRFRALRAKAYMVETEESINITVAGVNKQAAVPYLCKGWAQDLKTRAYINDPMQRFDDGLSIPKEYTGKLTHIYLDEPMTGQIVDYMGKTGSFCERSAIHLEMASYDMSLTLSYLQYLQGFRAFGK